MISENDPTQEDWVCVHKVGTVLDDEEPAFLFCSPGCVADYMNEKGFEPA